MGDKNKKYIEKNNGKKFGDRAAETPPHKNNKGDSTKGMRASRTPPPPPKKSDNQKSND